MTGCARCGVGDLGCAGARTLRLPAVPGITDLIGPPESTRVRAVARREVLPEQCFGGEHACHRNRQHDAMRGARQPIYSRAWNQASRFGADVSRASASVAGALASLAGASSSLPPWLSPLRNSCAAWPIERASDGSLAPPKISNTMSNTMMSSAGPTSIVRPPDAVLPRRYRGEAARGGAGPDSRPEESGASV